MMEPVVVTHPLGDDPPAATLWYGRDARETLRNLPDKSVQTICTSPPYWGLRDYGVEPTVWGGDPACRHEWDGSACRKCGAWLGALGLEPDFRDYIAHLVEVLEEARRVLRDDGTFWLNLGDSYASGKGHCFNPGGGANSFGNKIKEAGARVQNRPNKSDLDRMRLKEKDLIGIPWRAAFALQERGWWLRSDIVWKKSNGLPESVTDRPTKAHEYIFLLTKSSSYFYDTEAVRERPADGTPGRNRRSVWSVPTQPFDGAHFATWPPDLVRLMIKAGTSEKGRCPVCGAPWRRIVGKEGAPGFCYAGKKVGDRGAQVPSHDTKKRLPETMQNRITTGWEPSCGCPAAPPVRCAVMDIFSGSGTTGMVSFQENRDFIGIDLNPKYLELAKARIVDERSPSDPSDQDDCVLTLF